MKWQCGFIAKSLRVRNRAVANVAMIVLLTSPAVFAEPRIDRIEPPCVIIGETTEVTVFGDRLTEGNSQPIMWSGFSADWKCTEAEQKLNPRELRFLVTVPDETKPGAGAVRACTNTGVSPPFLLLLDTKQSTTGYRLESSMPVTHTFKAIQGQTYFCEAWSRRLNQDTDLLMSLHDAGGKEIASADDDEVIGFDPTLKFTALQTGIYTLQLHDNQWRSGSYCCVRIAGAPLRQIAAPAKARHTSTNPKPIAVRLKAGQFLTVTPRTRVIGSPAMLLMELHDSAGRHVAQSGTGDVADEPLRYRADNGGDFQLVIRDLIERSDLPFDVDISTDDAPFLVQFDGRARDRQVVRPGGRFKIRVRATRFRYDGPITIECPNVELSDNIIPEKRNDVEVRIRVDRDAKPGTLLTFRFTATADINGKVFQTSVQTRHQLEQDSRGLTQWPKGLDGTCYAVVTAGGKDQ